MQTNSVMILVGVQEHCSSEWASPPRGLTPQLFGGYILARSWIGWYFTTVTYVLLNLVPMHMICSCHSAGQDAN